MGPLRRTLALLCLAGALPACAAILGDDFVISDEDETGGDDGAGAGSSTSSGVCDDEPTCDLCIQCGCYDEWSQCHVSNAECAALAGCGQTCAPEDQFCLSSCLDNFPGGLDDYNALYECQCNYGCPFACGEYCF